MYVRIQICVATFDTVIPSLIAHIQSLLRSKNFVILQSILSAELAIGSAMSGETIRLSISLRLAVDCLRVTYIKDKQMLLFYLYLSYFGNTVFPQRRSQRPRGLRRGSGANRLLRTWVRIPPGAWMFVCCVLSGRGLCDGLITRPGESYRLWCVVVCDLETS